MGTLIKNAKHLDCMLWTELSPHFPMLKPHLSSDCMSSCLMTHAAEQTRMSLLEQQ